MNNLKVEKKKKSGALKGKGFYLALAACLLAIGAAAWTTFSSLSSLTEPSESGGKTSSGQPHLLVPSQAESTQQTENPVSGVTVSRPEDQSSKPGTSSKPESQTPVSSQKPPASSTKPVTVTPSTFIMPVAGKVTKTYSDGQAMYSMTFGDWRTHNGVDLAAAKGSTVQAIGDGKVKDVYQDDMLGTVVVIEHEAGIEASYCGLGTNPSVKKGETVKSGQTIGAISQVPGEIVEESHLHFEVKKDGVLVEPLAAIGKQDKLPSEKE